MVYKGLSGLNKVKHKNAQELKGIGINGVFYEPESPKEGLGRV